MDKKSVRPQVVPDRMSLAPGQSHVRTKFCENQSESLLHVTYLTDMSQRELQFQIFSFRFKENKNFTNISRVNAKVIMLLKVWRQNAEDFLLRHRLHSCGFQHSKCLMNSVNSGFLLISDYQSV